MFVYVLCAGAAITSLGLALATRFSRVGWAVGTTVFALRAAHRRLVLPDAGDVCAALGGTPGDLEPVHVGRERWPTKSRSTLSRTFLPGRHWRWWSSPGSPSSS